MTSKQKKESNRIGRGRFLRFLGGIGLLSLIPGLPASAQESKFESRKFKELRRTDTAKILKSPSIKGRLLSEEALTTRLATKNLENIRDMMTGRFFGRVAENAFRDGYVPLIKWGLGQTGSDNGCFFYLMVDPEGLEPEVMSNCIMQFIAREDGKMIFLDIYNTSAISQIPLAVGSGATAADCGEQCSQCNVQCAAGYSAINLHEVVSYPADKFASELMDILKTKDIDKIQQELKAVIFSDEVLNMGLQHFVNAAHGSMVEGIEAQ